MMRVHARRTDRTAAAPGDVAWDSAHVWMASALILVGLMSIVSGTAAGTEASAPAPSPAAVVVSIKDFHFSPQNLTVPAGSTVIWKNLDDEPHTVRGADAQIRSDALDQDESYSVKFDKPGTYKYGCSIHPRMSGTVVVQ
jgi:plastocyanin